MQFSVKTANYQNQSMLNICDTELLGKKIIEGDLTMHISENYYGERFVEKDEAESLLNDSSIINLAGKETVSLALKLGIGSENAVKVVSDVPFLIIFNM